MLATQVSPQDHEEVVAELRRMNQRLDRLSAGQQPLARNDRTEVDRDGRTISNDVAAELRALRQSLHKLEDGIQSPDTHDPRAIKKRYPTTQWRAVRALLAKASEDTSKLERELKLLRPQQVLDRFGAPSKIEFGQNGFEWRYHSPEIVDGNPKEWLSITFQQGYVHYVSVSRQ
jgi:exonuclease VII large subunit